MSQERLNRVLVGPIVSEKSTMLADKNNQIAFRVVKDATKKEVKDAVELKGKQKRFGRFEGRRSDVRKAYVCLKPGQDINFAQEVK